jgi:hypothetical protein
MARMDRGEGRLNENRAIFRRRSGKMLAIPRRKPYFPRPFSRLRTIGDPRENKAAGLQNRPI